MSEEMGFPPPNMDAVTPEKCSGRRFSMGQTHLSVDGKKKKVPHYLRASTGSCHDICKYGRRQESEIKPWSSASRREKAEGKPPEKIVTTDAVSADRKSYLKAKPKPSSYGNISLLDSSSGTKQKVLTSKKGMLGINEVKSKAASQLKSSLAPTCLSNPGKTFKGQVSPPFKVSKLVSGKVAERETPAKLAPPVQIKTAIAKPTPSSKSPQSLGLRKYRDVVQNTRITNRISVKDGIISSTSSIPWKSMGSAQALMKRQVQRQKRVIGQRNEKTPEELGIQQIEEQVQEKTLDVVDMENDEQSMPLDESTIDVEVQSPSQLLSNSEFSAQQNSSAFFSCSEERAQMEKSHVHSVEREETENSQVPSVKREERGSSCVPSEERDQTGKSHIHSEEREEMETENPHVPSEERDETRNSHIHSEERGETECSHAHSEERDETGKSHVHSEEREETEKPHVHSEESEERKKSHVHSEEREETEKSHVYSEEREETEKSRVYSEESEDSEKSHVYSEEKEDSEKSHVHSEEREETEKSHVHSEETEETEKSHVQSSPHEEVDDNDDEEVDGNDDEGDDFEDDEHGSEYLDDESEVCSHTELEEYENTEEDFVNAGNNVKRRPRKEWTVHPEGDPVKLQFRRGRVVEIQSVDNAPRRLKFRRGRSLAEKEAATAGTQQRRSQKKRDIMVDNDDDPSSEKHVLRHSSVQERKDAQGLLNNVIEETASKLVETRKSKVMALVGAFETVISLQDGKPSTTTDEAI